LGEGEGARVTDNASVDEACRGKSDAGGPSEAVPHSTDLLVPFLLFDQGNELWRNMVTLNLSMNFRSQRNLGRTDATLWSATDGRLLQCAPRLNKTFFQKNLSQSQIVIRLSTFSGRFMASSLKIGRPTPRTLNSRVSTVFRLCHYDYPPLK
jgi:hypothetical protein